MQHKFIYFLVLTTYGILLSSVSLSLSADHLTGGLTNVNDATCNGNQTSSRAGTCHTSEECDLHRACIQNGNETCECEGAAIGSGSLFAPDTPCSSITPCPTGGCTATPTACATPVDFDCDGDLDFNEWNSGSPISDPTDPDNGTPSSGPLDTDNDGVADNCDLDDDNDGVADVDDDAPLNPNICQDLDLDTCDDCAVGDDVFGPNPDFFPLADGLDTDGDGICDAGEAPMPPTLDVVLTMDRSGSMNGTAADPVAGTKLIAMRAAASSFVDQLAVVGVHRLGLVQFNTSAAALPGFGFQLVDTGNSMVAKGEITSSATGGTNIISGLDEALNTFDTSPQDRRAVVLFTDGQHNSPSVLSDVDLTAGLLTSLNAAVPADPALQFYSIGFGTSISDVPLSNVAADTISSTDFHVNEIDPIIMAKGFTHAAINMMDNVPLMDPLFVLKLGQQEELTVPVSVADQTLTFVIHWDRYINDLIETVIIPPSAKCSIVNQNRGPDFQQAKGINYRIVRVTVPFYCAGSRDHAGDWTVRVRYPGDNGTDANNALGRQASERVNIIVYGTSGIKLRNNLTLSKSSWSSIFRTGQNLQISSHLTAFGTALKDVTFTAFVSPPLPVTSDSADQDKMGSDPDSVPKIPVPKLSTHPPFRVALNVKAASMTQIDGFGSMALKDKGLYHVRVVAKGADARDQAIQREQISTIYYPDSFWKELFWFIVVIGSLCLLIWIYRKKRRYRIY